MSQYINLFGPAFRKPRLLLSLNRAALLAEMHSLGLTSEKGWRIIEELRHTTEGTLWIFRPMHLREHLPELSRTVLIDQEGRGHRQPVFQNTVVCAITRAEYARQARMSSRVRYGYSLMMSSGLSPAARNSMTVWAVSRVPAMTGRPLQMSGLMMMRSVMRNLLSLTTVSGLEKRSR